MTVVEVQLCAVDGCLIGFQRRLVLGDGRALCLQDLLSDGVLRDQRFVALQVDPRVLEGRLILEQLRLRLLELHLKGARIDLDERRAPPHHLAFPVCDGHELAIHSCPDLHGVDRRDRTQSGDVVTDVALFRSGDDDWHRRWRSWRRGLPRLASPPDERAGEPDHKGQCEPREPMPRACGGT